MEYTWDFKVILDSFPLLLRGLVVTIELWILAFAIGLSLGFAVSLARVSSRGWLNGPAIGYVELFRNTPVLVQLIWFYYAFPIVLGAQLRVAPIAEIGEFDLHKITPSLLSASRSFEVSTSRTRTSSWRASAAAVPAACPNVMTVGVSRVDARAS